MEVLEKDLGKKSDDKHGDKDSKNLHQSDNSNLLKCFKLMERMVVLNDQHEKYHDYKYYLTP